MIGAAATRCRLRRNGVFSRPPGLVAEQPRRHLGGSPVDESRIILSPLGKHRTLVERLPIRVELPIRMGLPIRVERAEPPNKGDLTDFLKVLA